MKAKRETGARAHTAKWGADEYRRGYAAGTKFGLMKAAAIVDSVKRSGPINPVWLSNELKKAAK